MKVIFMVAQVVIIKQKSKSSAARGTKDLELRNDSVSKK